MSGNVARVLSLCRRMLLVHRENYRAKPEELEACVMKAREVFALFAHTESAGATPPPLSIA
jgi:hypothetical protein